MTDFSAWFSTQDADVCKYYICGFDVTCFKNTKSDADVLRCVGAEAQEKVRDDGAREAFRLAPEAEKAKCGYEMDTKMVLDRMIRECDRRIERGMVRARAEKEEAMVKMATSADADTLRLLEVKMKESAAKAEKLGEEGDVDGAEAELAHLETFEQRAKEVKAKMDSMDAYRLTEPCPVSGTLLCNTDTEERRQEHLMGKQYTGWTHIRKLRDELAARLAKYEEAGFAIGGRSGGDGRDRKRRSRSPDRDRSYRPRDNRDREYGRGDGDTYRGGGDRRYEPYRDDRRRGDDRRSYDRRDDRRRDDRYRYY